MNNKLRVECTMHMHEDTWYELKARERNGQVMGSTVR